MAYIHLIWPCKQYPERKSLSGISVFTTERTVDMGVIAALWSFVIAYLRNRITREQLNNVFEKVLGDSGVKLASRLSYATIFGPLFAWYLLARGVKGLVAVTVWHR